LPTGVGNNKQQRQGLDLDANRFTEEELKGALEGMAIKAIASETKPELPSKFESQKWVSWSKKVKNFLGQVRGCNNTPLIYVIRKVRTPMSTPFTTTEEKRIFLTSHRGAAYNEDNQTVFQLLTQMLSGTGAWTWICMLKTAKNGKGAYEALRNEYDGLGQVEKQLGYARNILANTHY
jgi:hypothetical protein